MEKTISILLVEDDEDDQDFFARALRLTGKATLYAVAGNGMEALEKLSNAPSLPDMIFSDINMPKMNGIQYLLAMGRNPLIKHIPTVMFTSDKLMASISLELGAAKCIEKTANILLLSRQLEQLIDQNVQ